MSHEEKEQKKRENSCECDHVYRNKGTQQPKKQMRRIHSSFSKQKSHTPRQNETHSLSNENESDSVLVSPFDHYSFIERNVLEKEEVKQKKRHESKRGEKERESIMSISHDNSVIFLAVPCH